MGPSDDTQLPIEHLVRDDAGRLICTAERPYSEWYGGLWLHPLAEIIRSCDPWYGPSYDTYGCPLCGIVFHVEVAQ